ncbi:hypothetical protein Ancab_032398 [Ancistrocladus abbreviatus]
MATASSLISQSPFSSSSFSCFPKSSMKTSSSSRCLVLFNHIGSPCLKNGITATSSPSLRHLRRNKFSFHLNPRTFLSSSSSSSSLRVFCSSDSNRTLPVTVKSWETVVLKSECPVLVEFYASWCGPCQMVHRVIDELAVEYGGKLKCFMVDTDNDLQIAENYEIKAVPVVLIFKDGQKRDSITGTMPKEFYAAAIEKVLVC